MTDIKKGDKVRDGVGRIHTVLDIWDNVLTTDKGHLHISNVMEIV